MPIARAKISISLAERHEALWLRLANLHKDIAGIAAKKPEALVGASELSVAEGLIRECRPFLSKPIDPLPGAALHFSGLAVQLGQFLARLEDFENRHAHLDGKRKARVWRVEGEGMPVGRLRQEVLPYELKMPNGMNMREKLARLYEARDRMTYEQGFAAGRAARLGPPAGAPEPDTSVR